MATVVRLPARDPPLVRHARDRPADVVDLRLRQLFDMDGLKTTARELEVLPNPRDVEAAIAAVCKDFRRRIRKSDGVMGKAADGIVAAVRIALRAEVNRIRTRKVSGDGRDRAPTEA